MTLSTNARGDMERSGLVSTVCFALVVAGSVQRSVGEPPARAGGRALVSNGQVTPVQDVPWHAAIYRLDDHRPIYDLLCGATLIAPDLVVTAAHCFWDDHPNIPIAQYNVTLGKFYQAWDVDFSAASIQHMSVQQIFLHPRFQGAARSYEYDVALVRLTTAATMTRFVQVASLDWERHLDEALANGTMGVVAGWGLTSNSTAVSKVLLSIQLPYVDVDTCSRSAPLSVQHLISRGKFCAGYINMRRSVCPGDSGGGYVVRDAVTNRSYVRGVVSTNLQPSNYQEFECYADHYMTFTDLADQLFLDWIKSLFPTVSTPVSTPAPGPFCPPVASSASVVLARCHKNRVTLNCSEALSFGSKVIQTCREGFMSTGKRTNKTLTCDATGSWSKQGLVCRPLAADCGLQDTRTIRVHEITATTDQPWLVLVYYRSDGSSDWIFRGAATLITTTHVVTAAYDVTHTTTSKALPAANWQLAAGKHLTYFSLHEPDSQIRGVSSVMIHEQYGGEMLVQNIALLVADRSFQITWNVNVACVDWSGSLQPSTNPVIIAVGRWNINSTSEVLASQSQELVSHRRCYESAWEEERVYLQDDDICARKANGDTCYEVVGAGLLMQLPTARGARFFLRGVRSAWLAYSGSNLCYREILSAYTDVKLYSTWIQEHLH